LPLMIVPSLSIITTKSVVAFSIVSSVFLPASISSCAFFCSVGMFFYANSWLDTSIAEPTEEKMMLRSIFLGIYLFLAVIVAAIWLTWIHEDGKAIAVQVSEHEQNEDAKK